MEKIFVRDLREDAIVDSPFIVNAMQVQQKKNGEDFLSLTLGDRTGEIRAVLWDGVAGVVDYVSSGDYVHVNGRVGSYRDSLQMTISRLQKIEPDGIDKSDFIAATNRNVDKMWSELTGVVDSIKQPHLRSLLTSLLSDDAIADRFKRAPAAKGHHHVFLGGLLEHTLSIVRLCELVADHYPELLDRDMLVAGGVLHDIGKTTELSYDRNFDYTDEGRLIGHIVMAASDLDSRMRDLEFPDKLRIKILHMVVSHHGEEMFGSPRKPMTPEAIALHFIDMLDSRLEMARAALEKDAEAEGNFTGFLRGLDRFIYKG